MSCSGGRGQWVGVEQGPGRQGAGLEGDRRQMNALDVERGKLWNMFCSAETHRQLSNFAT